MKKIPILPTLFTLGNVFCGLLAMAKAVDGLAEPELFYRKMESACALVFLGMVFDSLDGWIARLTRGFSDFGAQLDSLADALTFGLVPAFLAKVLIEHEGVAAGIGGSPRLHFLAAASYSVMAILRLARFNLEEKDSDHGSFRGLPSPAAAGAVVSILWLYLVLSRPELEQSEGTPTPFGAMMGWFVAHDWSAALSWGPSVLVMILPVLGLLMVSRVPYTHGVKLLSSDRGAFPVLVAIVFGVFLLYLAPVPILFLLFNGYALFGVLRRAYERLPSRAGAKGRAPLG